MFRIGLSYDQGTSKYPLYEAAIRDAAERYGYPVEPVWLAGRNRAVDDSASDSLDGLVLTGGADVEPRRYGFEDPDGVCIHVLPERDEAELPIVDFAIARRLPIFAICRGMQLLNVAQGGSLVPDLPDHEFDDALRHPVRIDPASRLGEILGVAIGEVSSSHHQAIARPGDQLCIVASSPDGIVEAIEWKGPDAPWLVAVQWHPERMALEEPLAGPLYRAFFEAIAVRKPAGSTP